MQKQAQEIQRWNGEQMENNLTSGNIFKNIVSFSLPYLLSYFLQTLYGMADLFIIGQFEGPAGTTAVSIGSQIMHMLTVMIVGLAMGTTVNVGQAIGAGDQRRASKTVGNTVLLFLGASVIVTAVLLLGVKQIVALMSTPVEAVNGTVSYLIICFLGIPFVTAYNVISSIFRGLGDSKSPMYFVAVACVCNIALDFLFMGALKMGPSGAALGTTLSQGISVLAAVFMMLKNKLGIRLHSQDFRPERSVMGQILRIGAPIALQDGLIQFAAVPVVGLFTTDAAVRTAGGQYLRGYIWDCIFPGIHFSFSGYFCACGRSELSFLHNIIAIVCVRIPGVYLTSMLFPDTLLPMGLATACGSLLSVVICLAAYYAFGADRRVFAKAAPCSGTEDRSQAHAD